jgi:hypothetical protein
MFTSIKLLSLFFFISLTGCGSLSDFNQTAYNQAVSIKTDALSLVDKANEDYSTHRSEIDSLKLNVEQAYLFSKSISNNTETTSQWEIIRDPQRNSLFGFLERWKNKNTLSDTFISQVKTTISFDFDMIISLENGKRKISANKAGE